MRKDRQIKKSNVELRRAYVFETFCRLRMDEGRTYESAVEELAHQLFRTERLIKEDIREMRKRMGITVKRKKKASPKNREQYVKDKVYEMSNNGTNVSEAVQYLQNTLFLSEATIYRDLAK